ncbi:hypothetical protein L210DRAFT_3563836 [Boletus edulis BED1]|uniref:Uncharacterized protein n=1 Tax=Boletus edulis BED1 TaxID=1328754 RepID=A0AAD4G811_BOLED|nr:hypothetical protein L210DRAFT_3577612 [Boletus edulis BED1]KAF8428954.1 hypothetical protein L210DRAFT_3563836 [Boletus edulis BED1]
MRNKFVLGSGSRSIIVNASTCDYTISKPFLETKLRHSHVKKEKGCSVRAFFQSIHSCPVVLYLM